MVFRLFEAVEKVRETAAIHGVKLAEDFLVHLLHGEATKKASGKIADAYQSRASGVLVINGVNTGICRSQRDLGWVTGERRGLW